MKYLLNIIQPENNLKNWTVSYKYSNVDPNALGMKNKLAKWTIVGTPKF
jgi:hypothetical protein